MRIALSIIIILLGVQSYAQEKMGLMFLNDLHQSSQFNPAYVPEEKPIRIGLPSVYYQINHEGPVLDDFVVRDDKKLTIDLGKLIEGLDEDKTRLGALTEVNFFQIGFGNEKFYVQLSQTVKAISSANYSKDLAELLWYGNGPYVGQTLNLSSDIRFQSYNETALTLAGKFDKISAGVTLKYLSGLADLRMTDPKFNLTTEENTFNLTFDTDFIIQSSGIIDYQGLDMFGFDFNTPSSIFTSNTGFGIDLGIKYQPSESLTIGASILDLGSITWDENVETVSSKQNASFTGIQLEDLVSIGDLDFSADIDTIEQLLDIKSEKGGSYKTDLDSKFNAHAQLDATDELTLGALVQYRNGFLDGEINYSLWASYELLDFLRLGASITGYEGQPINLGANFLIDAGPVQFYALSYNIESFFRPYQAKKANGRIGLNLKF